MAQNPNLTVPEAVRFLLSEERMQRFVDLYNQASASKDEKVTEAADEALRHFKDAEAALTRMMASEAAVNAYLQR